MRQTYLIVFTTLFITFKSAFGQVTYSNLVVDPVGPPLTNYTSLGEWNVDGNFENWNTADMSNTVVLTGALTGTASGTDARLMVQNIVGGADLDLGFNDYLDIRLQLPADYNGDVVIQYGTTATPNFSGTRVLTIPSARIPKDGAFHVYRFDLGLEIYWRSFLRDIRIDPLDATGTGKTFSVDYVRVGDLTGDIYLPRYTTGGPAPGVNHELGRPVIEMVSKRFRFLWDTVVATQNGWTANTPRGTLRNLEECWQFYVKILGYREPSESWNPANRNGNKYKVNMSTWHSGYWAGNEAPGSVAHGRLNITPDGLRVDPPTWVIPHELMHVFQFHQRDGGQTVHGSWSEGHANYGRELWLNYFQVLFPANERSGIDANYIHSGHMIVAHGRDYYLSWPFFMYLDENPDGLPDLGFGTVANIWKSNQSGVYPYNTLEQMTPVSTLKEIIGNFAKRQLTFDYQNQTAITNALNTQTPTVWRRFQLTELVQRPDDTNWWRVPMQIAPMQGAYATHELIPHGNGDDRVVTVNFHGLPDSSRGADWRASFIAIANNGAERYSTLWNAGSNSITLASNENRLYLCVAGTPNTISAHEFSDVSHPYRSHASKFRFHYEVQVFGATPRESTNNTAGLVQHANGGGWKSTTATVDATAYIGPNARVLNTAQVRNTARIEDYAVVSDTAQVLNTAVVSGHAWVRNNSRVRNNARVRDWAIVSGSAAVADNARVLQHAQVTAGIVTNFAIAKGCAILQGGLISGWGIIDGDFMASRNVSNGVAFGHLPFSGVPDEYVRSISNRLYARYEFSSANQSMVRDETGVTDGYAIGSPAWSGNLAGRSGVLSFNGTNQYVALDRSLSDFRDMTVAVWARWSGGASNQPIWHFGSATNKSMFLTPDDGTGHLKFNIRNGGAEQSLVAPAALLSNVWTHIIVTVSNGTIWRLYINSILQQEANAAITPEQLNAPNTGTGAQHNYLARGQDNLLPFYKGALDSFRVYSRALPPAEIATLAPGNTVPILSAISNFVVNAGVTLVVTNTATDPGLPWETLTFSISNAPSGAAIETNTGVFTWRPSVAQANSTNNIQVRVTDNGLPNNLSASRNFTVTVSPVGSPTFTSATLSEGQFALQVNGDASLDYTIQSSTNLVDWTTVFTTNSPALPFEWVDPSLIQEMLFYRILLGP
jgi:carbonic anhydrase/acetyltransferase-like protein (isoleucine patch superfamily)